MKKGQMSDFNENTLKKCGNDICKVRNSCYDEPILCNYGTNRITVIAGYSLGGWKRWVERSCCY